MKSISDGLRDSFSQLMKLSEYVNTKDKPERIHKDNTFNRRFSTMLDSFSDFEAVGSRIELEIANLESLNQKIRALNANQDSRTISKEGNLLRTQTDKIRRGLEADFKSLYIFSKIFLDKHTALFRFVFGWRDIGDKSVTSFFNDIDAYKGEDPMILSFREACLRRLKSIDVFITEYRDDYVVHDQTGHKETRWFISEMNGNIRFIGGRPSITPQELVFIVSNYIYDSMMFLVSHV